MDLGTIYDGAALFEDRVTPQSQRYLILTIAALQGTLGVSAAATHFAARPYMLELCKDSWETSWHLPDLEVAPARELIH